MKFLFVHQNMPGQYRELVQWLARQNKHQIAFLTQRKGIEMQGVHKIQYPPHHKPKDDAYALSSDWEAAVGVAAGATEALRRVYDCQEMAARYYHWPCRMGGDAVFERHLPRCANHWVF